MTAPMSRPITQLGRSGRLWRVLGAAAHFSALAVVVSATVPGSWAADADRALFEHVQANRTTGGIAVARAVSALAEPAVAYPLLAVAGVHIGRRAGWQHALWPCLAVASGAAVRRRLSRVIARPRPPEQAWLTEPEGFSLPSKHTTLAVLTVGACMRATGIGGAPARAAPLLAAAAIGASRVSLGVHWPADVVSGWLFAEGWLCLADGLAVPAGPGRTAM